MVKIKRNYLRNTTFHENHDKKCATKIENARVEIDPFVLFK